MSIMSENSITIFEAVQHIRDGKYVMPAFQRQFVWDMERIEKLWDSILLDYPIAAFLFWRLDEYNVTWDTRFCEFLQKIVFDSRKQPDGGNYALTGIDTDFTDTAVLDGQQRLTSLFLSLMGDLYLRPNYARRGTGAEIPVKLLIELNEHHASPEGEYNSKQFDIRFTDKVGKTSPTQFEIREILADEFRDEESRADAIEKAIANVPTDSRKYARGILQKLCRKVYHERLIRYTEIIGMNHDDALEMFVRFNSGGRPLKKSEITMSILEAYWPEAKAEFGKVLSGPYKDFGTDFIIRLTHMLYGDVVMSNINGLEIDTLRNNWNAFKGMLKKLQQLLEGWKIDISRFSGSWNVLLPLAYSLYYDPDYMQNERAMKSYLLRAIFFTYFRSGTTGKLRQMKIAINSFNYEITYELLDQINDLRVTDGKLEDIVTVEKGSRVAGEILYYLSHDWVKNRNCEQDHLHPFARFDEGKPVAVPFSDWKRWRNMRNRLPNLHLLDGRLNASKGERRLIDYYGDMTDTEKSTFRERAMIPDGVSLELEAFENFYNARKTLLTKKIRQLLCP